MSDEKIKNHSSNRDERDQSEHSAQVLPFRRQLKSLDSTLPRSKNSKYAGGKNPRVKSSSPKRLTGVQSLQAVLLIIALVLTLKNCGTI
jgi:hypothetical protein